MNVMAYHTLIHIQIQIFRSLTFFCVFSVFSLAFTVLLKLCLQSFCLSQSIYLNLSPIFLILFLLLLASPPPFLPPQLLQPGTPLQYCSQPFWQLCLSLIFLFFLNSFTNFIFFCFPYLTLLFSFNFFFGFFSLKLCFNLWWSRKKFPH